MIARGIVGSLAGAVLVTGIASTVLADDRCDRSSFGGWTQRDHRDTRARVLERDAVAQIVHAISKGGKVRVAVGGWADYWTGIRYRDADATRFHIDHIIPICFAWTHGASEWSEDRRRAFYNDMELLVVMSAGQNRKKSDRFATVAMPEDRARACDYIHRFGEGIIRYGLTLSEDEQTDLANARAMTCGGVLTTRL